MPTQTFTYNGTNGINGSTQTFVVPEDVSNITIECWGAEGQTLSIVGLTGYGGLGGYIKGIIPVTEGETLEIEVGGYYSGSRIGGVQAYNGGGEGGISSAEGGIGGGGSDVRRTPYTVDDRLIVAGGGGGGTSAGVVPGGDGGDGGYPEGGPGTLGGGGTQPTGGTQSAGGIHGTDLGQSGLDGDFGVGGHGWRHFGTPGGSGGGGGGGGWWGGGGGGETQGGGGGSSSCPGGILVDDITGTNTGHGQVTFTWTTDSPPVQVEDETAWELRVYDGDDPNPFDNLLAVVPRWTMLKFSRPLSDVGAGEVQILRDDPLWVAIPGLLDDSEHLWTWWENGELRFSMYAEDIDENHVDDSGRPIIKITGRDGAKLLQHITVLPPGYPSHTQKNHDYNAPAMSAWFDLLSEADGRSAVPAYFVSLASESADSAGAPYVDTGTVMSVPPGGDLLEKLNQWAPVSECDWMMLPDMELVVKRTGLLGGHFGDEVIFHVARSMETLGEKRTRREIRSHVFIEAGDGSIVEANDSSVATQWKRRELWLQSGNSADSSTADTVAAVTLSAVKNEAREIILKVRPYMPTRKVWIDFGLGDWIGIEWDAGEDPTTAPNLEELKVVAISMSVNEHGKTDAELVCNTRLQETLVRFNQIINKYTGAGGTSEGAKTSSLITSGQVIGASTLNELSDVIISGVGSGEVLTWDGSDWVNETPSGGAGSIFGNAADGSTTLTQSSAAPSGMTKTGSGTSTQFAMNRNFVFDNFELDDSAGGFLVKTNGYRLFVRGTLTIDAACRIHNDGNAASGVNAGAASAAIVVGAGAAGGNGGSGGNGTTGSSNTSSLGGNGGRGGNETGSGGGANGGTATAASDAPNNLFSAISLNSAGTVSFKGGAGGGGGDGAVAATGGGGGGGGGVCAVYAQEIQNAGSITATGGAGANGVSGNAGGGGGGGGGTVVLVYASGTVGTISAAGGAAGTGIGTGVAGLAGSNGTTWALQA